MRMYAWGPSVSNRFTKKAILYMYCGPTFFCVCVGERLVRERERERERERDGEYV